MNISVGLITHSKSRYLDSGGTHNEWVFLLNNFHDLSEHQIYKENKVNQLEVKYTFFRLNRDLNFFLYSVFKRQIQILKKNRYGYVNSLLYNMIQAISYSATMQTKFIFSKLLKKEKIKFNSYLIRQINITNAHINIMYNLSRNNNSNLLILEDDFFITNKKNFKKNLKKILKYFELEKNIKVLNVSESFTIDQLKINKIIEKKYENQKDNSFSIYELPYPVMNTACANIYRYDLLKMLIVELEKLDKYLLVPIDEKINYALGKISDAQIFKSAVFYTLEPGIFLQRSIHGG